MSFGKNDNNLGKVASYGGTARQKAGNSGRKRTRSASGGNKFYWAGTYKPTTVHADSIRLLRGDYVIKRADEGETYDERVPWYEFREHFHGGIRKSCICSGGPHFMDKKLREACHGCDIFWTEKDGNGRRVMSMSSKYGFALVDMGQFHKVPQTDKQGQYRVNSETSQPYMEWVKCTGLGCAGCQVSQENKIGHVLPWIMSKAHFETLNGYAESIGNSCTTCSGRGVVSSAMWQCSNPSCGDLIVDVSTTTATQEQIDELVNAPFTCTTCQHRDYPEEVIACVNCTPTGQVPNRASIFDVDMQIKLTKTGDGDATALLVLATSDPKALDKQFEDQLQYAPDMSKRCAPTLLDDQAQTWNIQAAPINPAKFAGAYGAGQPPQGNSR
jgi:hypothetical protein